ncbi:MFS transporter [Gordonia sp. NPDC127522]|uniref:MFS transporter n=1 Tax=Gordonia sp. NPDC127522 TaxID=3345390 RepID=UPI003637D980
MRLPQQRDSKPRLSDSNGWTVRLVLSLISLVILLETLALNYGMIATGLPSIMVDFDTDQGAWIQTSFLLVGAVISPALGKIADTVGKRKVLLACAVIASIGALLSAVAPSYWVLLAGRALSGVLVACLFLSYSLIRDIYPPRTVPMSVAIATSGMGLISIPVPFLTGWLIDSFGWRSIFWFFAIVIAVTGVLILVTTDESLYRLKARIDPLGAVLLGGGIGAVLIAVSFGTSWGWTDAKTLMFVLGGAALLILWAYSATRISEPLIDLRLVLNRPVGMTTIMAGMAYGSSAVSLTLMPLMCMAPVGLAVGYGFGVNAEQYALFQSPYGAATMIGGLIVGALVSRGTRPRVTAISGSALFGLASLLVIPVMESRSGVLLAFVLIGLGMGIVYGSIPNIQIRAVPPQLQASTASIVATSQSLMSAILPVIAFAFLNANMTQSSSTSYPVYSQTGMTLAWMVAGGAALVGCAAAVAIPRVFTQLSAPGAATSQVIDGTSVGSGATSR